MSKLQRALCVQGRIIKVNQYQSYSERRGSMITKYVVSEKRRTPEGKEKDFPILETYQIADVVKKLASLYGENNG